MQNVLTIAERHGLLIVFLNALLSQGGLPLPVVPTLMTVATIQSRACAASAQKACGSRCQPA